MRCCNFFKFVLIYSAFQVAFGLPVMASEISEVPANEVVAPHHIDKIEQPASTEKEDKDLLKASESTDAVIGLHCVEKEELKNSPTSEDKIEQLVDSEKEDKCPCDICISMLAGDKPVKNLTLQINLSFGNNEPVALSPSVSDGHIEQFIKNGFLAKRDTILYFIKNFYDCPPYLFSIRSISRAINVAAAVLLIMLCISSSANMYEFTLSTNPKMFR